MEIYHQTEDKTLTGTEVVSFPAGIKEAFDSLGDTLGRQRAFYGISWMDENDHVKYYAMSEEAFPGEGELHQYECLTIEKGTYYSETVYNWMSKTDCIKDVFHKLMANTKVSRTRPCIEWYQSDELMLCMINASTEGV